MTPSKDSRIHSLNCRQLSENVTNHIQHNDFAVSLTHRSGEPEGVNRITLTHKALSVELLPSKGLSIGEAFYQNRPIFWDPPVELVDPDTLVLASDEVWRDRQPAPGMVFIKTYMGGH